MWNYDYPWLRIRWLTYRKFQGLGIQERFYRLEKFSNQRAISMFDRVARQQLQYWSYREIPPPQAKHALINVKVAPIEAL